MIRKTVFILLVIFTLIACSGVDSQVTVDFDEKLAYNMKKPSGQWNLHYDLEEISGLTYDEAHDRLLAINDEKGKIYGIDPYSGDVINLYDFHKGGDYEGIAKVSKHVYVLKSNGKLYRYNTNKDKTKEIETKLGSKNDAEGLCYDQKKHSLLIACKGLPLNEKKSKKAIYRYDIDEEKLDTDPHIEIKPGDLEELVNTQELDFNFKWRLRRFSPSGIAIHPVSRDYYILSARGSMLLVMSEKQNIKSLVFLDINALPQPEGICFDSDNNLYISSEGKGGRGRLLKYKVQN